MKKIMIETSKGLKELDTVEKVVLHKHGWYLVFKEKESEGKKDEGFI